MKKAIILLLLLAGCTPVDVFMCPAEHCKEQVIAALEQADESIYFMIYSFTDADISDVLISKFKDGVKVKGVMEKSQRSRYSAFAALQAAGIAVQWDKNRASMHHKVLIIDEKTVITGSFNPTKNGNERNNENVVIIKNRQIAKQFVDEFKSLY